MDTVAEKLKGPPVTIVRNGANVPRFKKSIFYIDRGGEFR